VRPFVFIEREKLNSNPSACGCPPSTAVMSFINKIGKIFGTSSSAPVAAASRSVAKERLSVILAAQRGTHLLEGVDMEALQRDVMEVVQRHIRAAKASTASFNVKSEGDCQLFEMSVEMINESSSVSKPQ
ncbi:hypothetical protein ACHAXA_004418, partial [Cyclostephanos tholiformis]